VGREVVSIGKYRPFDGLYCLHLQDKAGSGYFLGLLCPEDICTMNLQTTEDYLPFDTAQHDYHLQQRRGGNLKYRKVRAK